MFIKLHEYSHVVYVIMNITYPDTLVIFYEMLLIHGTKFKIE